MANVDVSVIIPVYNGEKTIKACIDSVLAQTMPVEIIVINDGSDDKTGEILYSYGERITVIRQNRAGQGNARNVGIKKARGEYLGFVDADDTVAPDMYETMYRAAKTNDCQIVQCGIWDIRENGTKTLRSAFDEYVEISDRADYVFDYFYHLKHTNEVCNKLIKKSFLEENDLKFGDTKKCFSEDFKLNMEMILCLEKIGFVDKGFYNYYIKETGHCLGDSVGRIAKILDLFEDVLSREMDEDVRKSFECVAALTLLLYCRSAYDTDRAYVSDFLRNKQMRKYIKTSMVYRSNPKHFLLYFLINYAPKKVSLLLLHIFFEF